MTATIKRIYVRRYTDNRQVVARVEWNDGSTTQGSLNDTDHPHRRLPKTFGAHIHALFARANRQGLRIEKETW